MEYFPVPVIRETRDDDPVVVLCCPSIPLPALLFEALLFIMIILRRRWARGEGDGVVVVAATTADEGVIRRRLNPSLVDVLFVEDVRGVAGEEDLGEDE